MTGYLTRKIFYGILALLVFFVTGSSYAREDCVPTGGPDDPGMPGDEGGDCIDNPVPIDGGAGILIAAGVAYGLRKAYGKRKQNKEADIA